MLLVPCFLMSHFRGLFPLQTATLLFSLLTFVNCVAMLHLEVLTLVITCSVYSVLSINKTGLSLRQPGFSRKEVPMYMSICKHQPGLFPGEGGEKIKRQWKKKEANSRYFTSTVSRNII